MLLLYVMHFTFSLENHVGVIKGLTGFNLGIPWKCLCLMICFHFARIISLLILELIGQMSLINSLISFYSSNVNTFLSFWQLSSKQFYSVLLSRSVNPCTKLTVKQVYKYWIRHLKHLFVRKWQIRKDFKALDAFPTLIFRGSYIKI